VDEENIDLMLDVAGQPHWHDVVVMAGAHARPRERAHILRDLLQRADRATNRETFVLLAMAVLEQAPVLPTDQPEVRALVEDAMRGLIPPRSTAAADRLADVGPLVLDLLPDPAAALRDHGRTGAVRRPPAPATLRSVRSAGRRWRGCSGR
jgi:hypothetical protein